MTRGEEIPAGVHWSTLEYIAEDHGRAICCDERHQYKTYVSKLCVDAEEPDIENEYRDFGAGDSGKISYCSSFGPLDLTL